MEEQARQTEAAPLPERKYRVLFELGEGGAANVYLAVAQGPGGFNKLVVLKALKQHIAREREARRRFLAEARLSARLNHPNIVSVNEVTEHQGIPLIVMEYLEGAALSQVLRRVDGKLPLPIHLRVISDALSGLHYSHELTDYDGTPLHVVHRDVSPHNVFVTFDGQVKILDFGIAKLGSIHGEATNRGVVKGKIQYMAPEQVMGDKSLDRRADIFSAGVMLWEAAARQRLWHGLADATIMSRLLSSPIPSPRTVNSACSEKLEQVCLKALAPDREARHATAAELKKDVEEVISDLSGTVTAREVGQFLAGEFEEARDEAKRAIEKQLSEEGSFSKAGSARFVFPSASITRGYTRTAPTYPAPSRSRIARQGAALALGLAAVCAVGLWAYKQKQPPAAEIQAQAPAVPAASAAPVAPASELQEVRLSVRVRPSGATLYLDSQQLGTSPYEGMLPAETGRKVIRAEAAGFKTATREVTLDRDIDLVLVLEKEADEQAGDTPSHVAPAARHVGAPAPQPKPAGPNCNPPFYVDERGVKKYKPECL